MNRESIENKKRRNFDLLFKEGNVIVIEGLQESGKTDKVVYFMEQGVSYGYHCHTVINFFKMEDVEEAKREKYLRDDIEYRKKPDEIHIFRKLSTLLKELLKHKKNIVFLDESGFFATSTRATSQMTTTMKLLTYIIRHFNASIVFIVQSDRSIVPDIRQKLLRYKIRINRKSNTNRQMIIYKPINNEENDVDFIQVTPVINRVPSSQLPYDGKYIPAFEIDIKLEDLQSALAEHTSLELRKNDLGVKIIDELLKEQINKETHKKGYKKKMIAEIIQNHPEMEVKDIQELMASRGESVNRSYVSQVRSELGIFDD